MKYTITILKVNNSLKLIRFLMNYFDLSFTEAKNYELEEGRILINYECYRTSFSFEDLDVLEYKELQEQLKDIVTYSVSIEKETEDFDREAQELPIQEFVQKYQESVAWCETLPEEDRLKIATLMRGSGYWQGAPAPCAVPGDIFPLVEEIHYAECPQAQGLECNCLEVRSQNEKRAILGLPQLG